MNASELLQQVSQALVAQMTATGAAYAKVSARVGDTEIKVTAAIHGWSRSAGSDEDAA